MRFFSFLLVLSLTSEVYAQGTCPANPSNEFKIELIRLGTDKVLDNGTEVPRVYGDIGVNGQNMGRFYENPSVMIGAGTYKGTLRYRSNHDFVVSSCGVAARTGDFLLEINGVKDASGKDRTNLLFHPGMLPSHSKGCVLFGARKRNAQGEFLPLDSDYPLVKIRKEFYGTDNPVACPDKSISITFSGP